MTPDTLSFAAAFLVGLLGGAHCIGMCGGITGAFGVNTKGSIKNRLALSLSFNSGRIISYTLAGVLIGLISTFFTDINPMIGMVLRIIAGVFIILMGLYVADWSRAITSIEKVGQFIWKFISPLTKPFLPPSNPPKALMLGLLWGWLPCGLVYSTLVLASASPTVMGSASIMFAFGLGTLPTMLLTGMLASQLTSFIRNQSVRYVAAILMILMGVWIIFGNSQHIFGHGNHAGMDHSAGGHSTGDHSNMNHGNPNDTIDHSNMNHSESTGTIDHSSMDHSEMDHSNMDHGMQESQVDHSKMDHSKMNH
ncbi:sulfite exporter TauE/SafE family protein [Litoribacillus peritrichatus]|uniref:Urease accessory protein UreH-like transmembrane domain-containing protein n=1 Tax=Litoribacillus peritrichatus TaxID=718191 RepID=A0ABP7N517_9GAMM